MNRDETILQKSFNRALGGGLYGMSAMGIQVGSLMWLRTTINYQYRNGTTFSNTLKLLYNDGGIRRFYRGVGPALLQAPLSRFGDTAANTGVLYFLNNNEQTKNLPISIKTFCGSVTAGLWRINLMPIDTTKTFFQVNGKDGYKLLRNKIKTNGIKTLYNGSFAAFSSTVMGHFPWFFTFNYLNEIIPKINKDDEFHTIKKYSRYAIIGFSSTMSSDIISNSMRVIKTNRQTSIIEQSYPSIIKNILKKDGINGLLFRGLKTKLLANGLQGLLFTVCWKSIEEIFKN